jgi:hypothetical protein
MEEVKHIASFDEDGKVILKEKKKVNRGRLTRAQGARFEVKVRKDFEDRKWIVDKWTNNVDLENQNIIPVKRKIIRQPTPFSPVPFRTFGTLGTGFPDFIALKSRSNGTYDVIGVESKMNGILSKEEKAKCQWYLDKGIFSQIFVSKRGEKRGSIEHVDFGERWGN